MVTFIMIETKLEIIMDELKRKENQKKKLNEEEIIANIAMKPNNEGQFRIQSSFGFLSISLLASQLESTLISFLLMRQ